MHVEVVFFEARQGRKSAGLPVQDIQTSLRPYPHFHVIGLYNAVYAVVSDRFRNPGVVSVSSYPVRIVHGQPVVRAEPHHSAAVLEDALYGIRMQAVSDRYV